MTRERAVEIIKAIKDGLHETGKDFPYRDEIIPIAKEALEMAIKTLKQEPKWIPVSERLPDKDKYTDFYKCLVAVSCTSRNDICDSITAYFDGKHFYRHLYDRATISGIKAWMPLPEPYKAESESEK